MTSRPASRSSCRRACRPSSFRTVARKPRVLHCMRRGGLLDPGSISLRARAGDPAHHRALRRRLRMGRARRLLRGRRGLLRHRPANHRARRRQAVAGRRRGGTARDRRRAACAQHAVGCRARRAGGSLHGRADHRDRHARRAVPRGFLTCAASPASSPRLARRRCRHLHGARLDAPAGAPQRGNHRLHRFTGLPSAGGADKVSAHQNQEESVPIC